MQVELFSGGHAGAKEPLAAVSLLEHGSSSYAPRTGVNACSADLTVAFACDFETAGERLTKRVAGSRYVSVDLGGFLDVELAAQRIVQALVRTHGQSLNVAGNGIYTCARHGLTQRDVNQRIYEVLDRVHAMRTLESIRSGGQTGADVGGLVAGIAIGIPVIGLWPKGFKQRDVSQRDLLRTASSLEAELQAWARVLRG